MKIIEIKTSSKKFNNRNITKHEKSGQSKLIEIAKSRAKSEHDIQLIESMRIPLKSSELNILELIIGEKTYYKLIK